MRRSRWHREPHQERHPRHHIQGVYAEIVRRDETISALSARVDALEKLNAEANSHAQSLEQANTEAHRHAASLEQRLERIEARLVLTK